jgi:hypothetical protein
MTFTLQLHKLKVVFHESGQVLEEGLTNPVDEGETCVQVTAPVCDA